MRKFLNNFENWSFMKRNHIAGNIWFIFKSQRVLCKKVDHNGHNKVQITNDKIAIFPTPLFLSAPNRELGFFW